MSNRTRESYDRVAEQYAHDLADELRSKPLDRALLDAFAELVGAGPVADVGCGPGHVAAYLATRGVPAIGLDLSPAMCAIGRGTTALPFAAGDLCALPVRTATLAGVVCLYTVIHLDDEGRQAAYHEFARVLRPMGSALIAFHRSDSDTAAGGDRTVTEFLDHEVDLTFHFLDPATEERHLAASGLELRARLDRQADPAVEHASRRSYLLVRRP